MKAKAEKITNAVIQALEKGHAPWQKPWKAQGYLPNINLVSKKEYNGFNRVHLFFAGFLKGYTDKRWCTFKQAKDLGLSVRKGETATEVFHFHTIPVATGKYDENGDEILKMRGSTKFYYVFNVEQLEGEIEPDARIKKFKPTRIKQEKTAEQLLLNSQAVIKHDQNNRAFYRMDTDTIHLPKKTQFKNSQGYYSTALHELCHWTGHRSRLDRKLANKFGSDDYAREELRAEIGAWLLAEALEIDFNPQDSEAYLAGWVKSLQDHPLELMRACADAERIKQYLFDLAEMKMKKVA